MSDRSRVLVLVVGLVVTACTFAQTDAPSEPATWTFAPGQEIGPDTTEFVALVTERGCAGGQSSARRIIGPRVDYVDDTQVIVMFEVRPLGGIQACPGNPPTPVAVRLQEPLGDRALLDGGREPPSEPPVCADVTSCE